MSKVSGAGLEQRPRVPEERPLGLRRWVAPVWSVKIACANLISGDHNQELMI